MKATGIVRRIDDLGRVVIPKEIRRSMKIKEGEPLEIFTTSDGCVCFKKYDVVSGADWQRFGQILDESVCRNTDFAVYNGDMEREYATTGTFSRSCEFTEGDFVRVVMIDGNIEGYLVFADSEFEGMDTALAVLEGMVRTMM